ncbi:hypothetical protein P9112_014663 [Eukaryota sp. TZLM1-RC]
MIEVMYTVIGLIILKLLMTLSHVIDAVRQMNTRRRERNLLFINKTDS